MNQDEYMQGLEERYKHIVEINKVLIKIIHHLINSPQEMTSENAVGTHLNNPVDTSNEVQKQHDEIGKPLNKKYTKEKRE